MMLVKLLIALVICFNLPVIAFAHPGKTDSSGGHTDHSTGDYHYHHGYPAHDHYDMDGDGTVDCPYEFDDKTGSSSGDNSSSKTQAESATKEETSEDQNSIKQPKEKTKKTATEYVTVACIVVFGSFTLIELVLCGIAEIKRKLKK